MATYYNNGNNKNNNNNNSNNNNNNNNNNKKEIQVDGSDGLQTLLLMNPNTQYNSHHHLGPFSDTTQSSNSLVFLNSLTPRSLPHAPMQNQHLLGIPIDPNHPSHHHEIHSSFMPRVHYNMYPTETSLARVQQGGLSLSLSRVSTSSPRSEVVGKVNGGVLGSRYLKAAQEVLDEVVSVGKEAIKSGYERGGEGSGGGGGEGSMKAERREISTTERQEIQMKKAKLVGLLDEVEQRYRQYHHQMQIVISWFEQATGSGSAKTYTALALQTISKQFRCLKDAISTQIRVSSKSLGEEESFGVGKSEGGSRLKFVDHQLRQQRALQQLGMIQPNAWRPQRGLPERSVSVLRAWLFEHFLHPYPKDSDKIMLAKQTGLTRSQVSNWFINARVRLWKPMVEEMYTEEIKEKEHNGENVDEKTTKKGENNNENSSSKISSQQENTLVAEKNNLNFKSILDTPTSQNSPSVISASPSSTGVNIRHPPGFTLIGSQDMETIAHSSPKKQRNTSFLQSPNSYLSNEQISKFDNERQNRESFPLMGGPANFIGEFGGYPISEISRFGAEQFPAAYSGNGVALTLGLPHCENISQNFLQNQNIQMGRRLELGETSDFDAINASDNSHSSVAYESVSIQNRKRFAAQLLQDFVT